MGPPLAARSGEPRREDDVSVELERRGQHTTRPCEPEHPSAGDIEAHEAGATAVELDRQLAGQVGVQLAVHPGRGAEDLRRAVDPDREVAALLDEVERDLVDGDAAERADLIDRGVALDVGQAGAGGRRDGEAEVGIVDQALD